MLCAELSQRISAVRALLLMVGLWPYQQSKLIRIQQLLTFSILSSFIVFQFTLLITERCTSYLVIRIFSSALLFLICLLIYNSFWFHTSDVKYLLKQIEYICYQLKDRNEISIIDNYAFIAKRLTALIILVGIIFLILVHPLWPHVFDCFLSINDTNSHRTILIATEYFVDQEKYIYFIMLHMYAACCICVFSTAGTGAMMLIFIEHVFGMLRIARIDIAEIEKSNGIFYSYRIKQAMKIDIRQNIKYRFIKQEIKTFKGIVLGIDMHRKALNVCDFAISSVKVAMCFAATLSVICLSLNMFQIFQIVTSGIEVEKLILHLAYIIPIIVYMFAFNYLGQKLTDHNSNVFCTVYNVCWYMAPLSIQRLILFLLQRGNKPYAFSAAGLFIASLELFTKLTSTSLSYFTVMYSVQK